MTVRTILTEPNSILRQVSKPVEEVGNAERELMEDMLETMYATPNGIGLAAIQIGVPKRIVVLNILQKVLAKNYFHQHQDKVLLANLVLCHHKRTLP